MQYKDLSVSGWEDYELLDSGGNRKLERFGKYLIARPETQAIWQAAHPDLWEKAEAEFVSGGKGSWKNKKVPDSWEMNWQGARFSARLTSFRHTGVFPEQAANWEWLAELTAKLEKPKVLNLFGYTGIASIVAAENGAEVTHVDASKQSNAWAKANAELSGAGAGIRYILDDALKFAEREVRRGAAYQGIILDPPAFGRGAKGEVWHIEEDLPRLLAALAKLLSRDAGAFFLLNGYAAGYSPQSFRQAVEDWFPGVNGEFGELRLNESGGKRCIPSGIYVRFINT